MCVDINIDDYARVVSIIRVFLLKNRVRVKITGEIVGDSNIIRYLCAFDKIIAV
jgi:hypothetical protein